MLRSLDLFSGVGGITHALRGLAIPVLYCEKDLECHAVMENLMRQKKLPRARIDPDVSKLSPSAVPGKVDIIVAGFPCIGFSSSGKREGLDQPGSGLFRHVMRLARELRPPYMFFENVAAILENADIETIVRAIRSLGYAMYWVVMPAYAVGGPQKRARWFCLCVRNGVSGVSLKPSEPFSRFSWKSEPSPRMVPEATGSVRRRMRMLGNSVVPDCVRAAFLSLWTGCVIPIPRLLAASSKGGSGIPLRLPQPLGPLQPSHSARYACILSGTTRQRIPEPPGMLGPPRLGLVLDPNAYRSKTPVNKEMATSGLVKKPKPVHMWSTPRANNGTFGMNALTNRGSHDLGTQLRFERRTPAGQRKGVTNPDWADWLMGYPVGWTALPGDTRRKKTA